MGSRVCAYCGKTFETHAKRGKPRRFCSPACYYKHNVLRCTRRSSERHEQARRAWAGDEAATLYELAQQGVDKLEDYVYNNYSKKTGVKHGSKD